MAQDMSSFLLGGKIESLKYPTVGTEHTLTITDEPYLDQQKDFDTGDPLFWDDRTDLPPEKREPRMQLVLTGTVDESERLNAEDDLMRREYLKGEKQKAVGQAMRDAGAKAIEIGGKVWIKYTGDGTATGRKNPPKLYKSAYKAPEAKAAAQASFLGSSAGTDDDPPF